jgi:molybdate transport system ATP-binding protein
MTARLSVSLHAVGVRRGDKWVLQDISLRMKAGERWALIGGNGAGKTQLLKLIGTDVWPTPTATGSERRTYRLGRRHVDLMEAKRRIAYIGAELQDKYARYGWNLEVRDLLVTGLHRTDLLLTRATGLERRRVTAMLEVCGLTPLAGRRFLSLSYGEKRLVLLARGLVQDPDWLLLDEFYNGLDRDYRHRIDCILDRARANGQSWIASAHRAMDVPPGTGGLMELRGGKLHSLKRLQGADVARLTALANEGVPPPAPRPAKRAAGATLRPTRSGAATTLRPAKRDASTTPRSAKRAAAKALGPVRRAAGTTLRPGSGAAPVLLRIAAADLYVDYRDVLRDVNWELRAGEHWAVFGANGAGKSSFLKLLYGDLSPALGGTIERAGFPRGTPIETWKRHVGYVSPELQTEYAVDVSVVDLVASGRYASIGLCEAPTAADEKNARRWLRFFGLLSMAKRRPRELSYGQLRRALFARALAGAPRILLLDEPLTGLDPRQRAAMKRLLAGLMRQELTLIIAVHHAEDLPRGMTHALNLHNGHADTLKFHERDSAERDSHIAT